jgi:hypothetical protein
VTPEKQRIAIAEACGWCRCHVNSEDEFYGTHPIGIFAVLPNYLNDLNAIYEAEETMDRVQRTVYVTILWEKCILQNLDPYNWSVSSKATLRAEAFLQAIGKWEEAL